MSSIANIPNEPSGSFQASIDLQAPAVVSNGMVQPIVIKRAVDETQIN